MRRCALLRVPAVVALVVLSVAGTAARAQGAPQRVAPAHNASINGTRVTFRWTAVPGALSYTLCVAKPGHACGSPLSIEIPALGSTSYPVDIPPWLASEGPTLHWAITSCTAAGCAPYAAGYSAFTLTGAPAPPHLNAPAPDVTVRPADVIHFSWGQTTGAHTYRFCISRPGVACGAPGSAVHGVGGLSNHSIGIPPSFAGEAELHWTAAACAASGLCTYQPAFRRILVDLDPDDTIDGTESGGADDMGTVRPERESEVTTGPLPGDARPSEPTCTFADDADYSISSDVTLTGPAIVGGRATYAVTFSIHRQSSAGSAAPVVLLVDKDNGFRGADDLLSWTQKRMPGSAGWHLATVILTVKCEGDEIVGTALVDPRGRYNDPRSGEGGPRSFIGLGRDPANLAAKISWCRRLRGGGGASRAPQSDVIDVECAESPPPVTE